MILLEIICALLVGAVVGSVVMKRRMIDYKGRWKEALALLEEEKKATAQLEEGLLTSEQIEQRKQERYEAENRQVIQRRLHGMFSEDRAELEIQRAKKSLPPLDDLDGMFSEDIAAVMKARMHASTES
jgi:hypothetical protein